MAVSGLRHISSLFVGKDTQSLQRWLSKANQNLPNIHTERKHMSNLHNERPGKGVMYWEEEALRKTPTAPDFKGFLVLEMDYKAGEKLKLAAWQKPTSRGYNLLSISEDNWSKKQRETHKEVTPGYAKVSHRVNDDDVPF
jgi:hypothetical protein